MKMTFYDRHEKIEYYKTVEIVRQLQADPAMIATARTFVEQQLLSDPSQSVYGKMWMELLASPIDEITKRLLEDTPQGALLRETRPPFGRGFTSQEIRKIIEAIGC